MKRVMLIVAYDGTAYCGWQIQKNGITVEQVLNEQLSALLGEDIRVIGASRTDAGVHAMGNVAVFDTKTRIPGEKISYALNQRLPEDIRILGSREVEADFHPRYRNSTKTYEYRIYNGPFEVPLYRSNTYFFHRKLDVEKMRQAAGYFEGEHDFSAFCSVHAQVRETTRTIYRSEVIAGEEDPQGGRLLTFRISGNGFLYNMVRIIAGTLIETGLGKYPPERVKEIIDGGNRGEAGPCAPAKGLTLMCIVYEETLADELYVYNERMHYSFTQSQIKRKKEAYLNIFRCEERWLEDLIVRMTKKAFRLGAKHIYVRDKETPALSQTLAPSRHNGFDGGEFFTAGDFRYVLDHEVWQMDRDLRANPPVCRAKVAPEGDSEKSEQKDSAGLCGRLYTDVLRPENEKEQQAFEIRPLRREGVLQFCEIYNKCFYSQPCTMTLTEEQAAFMAHEVKTCPPENGRREIGEPGEAGTEKTRKLTDGGEEQGVLLTDTPRAYMAYVNGNPVGILAVKDADWDADALLVWTLGVEGKYRQKGYGRAMLEWTAAYAQSQGKKRVTLEVSSRNKKAAALYEKAGFYRIRSGENRWYRADDHKKQGALS